MPDDDRAVMERLAALEAEVKADADAQRARKEAALVKVREERAKQLAEREELRDRQAALVTKQRAPRREPEADVDHADGLAGALELAGRANKMKAELQKKPAKGEKSWVKSGALSLFGPIGWLYAGSWREAVPATAMWLVAAAIISKLGFLGFLLMPVLMVALPLSGLAGVMYALSYNRAGKRQRLFGSDKKKPKQLAAKSKG